MYSGFGLLVAAMATARADRHSTISGRAETMA